VVAVFLVEPLPRYVLELGVRWDGCPRDEGKPENERYGHHSRPIEFRDYKPSYAAAKDMSDKHLRTLLPDEFECMSCHATVLKRDLPVNHVWGGHRQSTIQRSGSLAFRRVDDRTVHFEFEPGMVYDNNSRKFPHYAHDRALTGAKLRKTDFQPLKPDPDHKNADGTPAQPHSMYGWEWVQACKAAGVWLPMWHLVLPTTKPWSDDGYRYDAVFPTYMCASNGAEKGEGYWSGWTADQWLDPTTMTLSPSIWHNKGGPTDWHGWLRAGTLSQA